MKPDEKVPDDRETKVPTGAEQKDATKVAPPPPDERRAKGADSRQESK